jgi:hypothetical protein
MVVVTMLWVVTLAATLTTVLAIRASDFIMA